MKYSFIVKHNGVLYEAGQEVPIGKEAKPSNELKDMSLNELKAKLKELGVTRFNGNSKAALIKQIEETLEAINEDVDVEEDIVEEDIVEDENIEEDVDNEDSELLNEIANEEE